MRQMRPSSISKAKIKAPVLILCALWIGEIKTRDGKCIWTGGILIGSFCPFLILFIGCTIQIARSFITIGSYTENTGEAKRQLANNFHLCVMCYLEISIHRQCLLCMCYQSILKTLPASAAEVFLLLELAIDRSLRFIPFITQFPFSILFSFLTGGYKCNQITNKNNSVWFHKGTNMAMVSWKL